VEERTTLLCKAQASAADVFSSLEIIQRVGGKMHAIPEDVVEERFRIFAGE
jgi:hypothetical protein